MESLASLLAEAENLKGKYVPVIYRTSNAADRQAVDQLIAGNQAVFVQDEIYGQLQELVKSNHPSVKIKKDDYPAMVSEHLAGRDIATYGVWVFYPWAKRLVHLLDEDEFVEVRTNRNRYKITREEQAILKNKKIGVIGLSVGQSIALTMAMERICGEIRLADFDTAELSNLNRIRTGAHNLGLNKTVIAAREIVEIDPFIKVRIFNDGITKANIDGFFLGEGKLDLLVEVCDGMDIKIQSRFKARELMIPVVMDTNDRGMMDVERFDLEPDRPILHGLAAGLDPENIKDLSNEDKIPYILKMIGADTISTRLKASMLEVEQSINTWPQLASSVTLGGALTTDVSRRILLDQYHESGRYYIDIEELIGDKDHAGTPELPQSYIGPPELTREDLLAAVKDFRGGESDALPEETIRKIAAAGTMAPSGGNAQPWKLLYAEKSLFIFHDAHFSWSLLDFNHLGSYVAIGAMIENISIAAAAEGYTAAISNFPSETDRRIVARITFSRSDMDSRSERLAPGISIRVTNRDLAVRERLPAAFIGHLRQAAGDYDGARLDLVEDETLMKELGKVLARAEMLRIIHPRGHYDTFTNELRWTSEEISRTRDGLDVNSLGATQSELAGFRIAGDTGAIAFLRKLRGGTAFTKMVNKSVAASSAIGIVTMPEYSELNFLKGGRAVERIWIEANLAGVSFQPISQLMFLLARLRYGKEDELGDYFKEELQKLQVRLEELLPGLSQRQPVFMFRLDKAGQPKVRSLRKHLDAVFYYSPTTKTDKSTHQ